MEDDEDLGETLEELLSGENYCVTWVKNGEEASEVTFETTFDLYVFDINVPIFDGISLLASLRDADDTTPAIFISALIDLETMTKAFKIGASDYLKKPFFPEELLLRIDAKFLVQKEEVLHYKTLSFYPSTDKLVKDNKTLYLSVMQMLLFKLFIENFDKIITKESILELSGIVSESALRVAINKLKKTTSLEIKNIHGLGYMLESC